MLVAAFKLKVHVLQFVKLVFYVLAAGLRL
jgi:hypothetical protein